MSVLFAGSAAAAVLLLTGVCMARADKRRDKAFDLRFLMDHMG